MDLKAQREAALKAARDLAERVKSAGRDFTDDERTEIDGYVTKADDLAAQMKKAEEDAERFKKIAALTPEAKAEETKVETGQELTKTLGEHFVKAVGDNLKSRNGRFTVSAPEFKANTTTQTVGSVFADYLTTIDTNIVTGVRRRLTIADLLGSGTLAGQSITYFVEGALEGDFTTVGEGVAKPQIHYVDPTVVTESLKKIAAFLKESDEMVEDLPFMVSAINGRLLYNLGLFEENQLLSGNGSGTNISGILDRTGIGTEASVSDADNPDAIFRAITKVQIDSGLDADGVVMNPLDYQQFRLMRDGNSQYYGGGFFAGEYGNGGIMVNPPLWGLRTVVTPAISAGTALVGAFAQAATVYRKGGVRVEATNSNEDDFTHNLVTIRAEERLALAVRRPAGFVQVTLEEDAS